MKESSSKNKLMEEKCVRVTRSRVKHGEYSGGGGSCMESPVTAEIPILGEQVQLEQPTKKKPVIALGQVVVWGKVFEELNNPYCGTTTGNKKTVGQDNFGTKLEMKESQRADSGAFTIPASSQPAAVDVQLGTEPVAAVDETAATTTTTSAAGDGNAVKSEVAMRRTNKKKRDPELMTKAEHLRILKLALRDTMRLSEIDLTDPNLETIRTTRSGMARRGGGFVRRKYKKEKNDGNGIDTSSASTDETQLANSTPEENRDGIENSDDDEEADDESQNLVSSDYMKPRFTYTELIEIALTENPEGLTVSEIYDWISNRHTYFHADDARWKNSVRHNLSINPYFEKSSKSKDKAGHIWTLCESYKCSPDSRPIPPKRPRYVKRRLSGGNILKKEFNRIVQEINGTLTIKQEYQSQDEEVSQSQAGQQSLEETQLYATNEEEYQNFGVAEGENERSAANNLMGNLMDTTGNYTFGQSTFSDATSEIQYADVNSEFQYADVSAEVQFSDGYSVLSIDELLAAGHLVFVDLDDASLASEMQIMDLSDIGDVPVANDNVDGNNN